MGLTDKLPTLRPNPPPAPKTGGGLLGWRHGRTPPAKPPAAPKLPQPRQAGITGSGGGLTRHAPKQAGNKALSPDQVRIIALPRPKYGKLDDAQWRKTGCEIQLRPIQLQALECVRQSSQSGVTGMGAFFPIGVGWGKTFISMLAGAVAGKKHALVLAPAPTIPQMVSEYNRLKESYTLPDITFQSYWHLSQQKDGVPFLDAWAEGKEDSDMLIVCDEAHKLKNPKSARTKRMWRFVREHQEVSVVALSGTMTSKSLKEYAHILVMCLREATPLPLAKQELTKWDNVLGVEPRLDWDAYSTMEPVLRQYDPYIMWRHMRYTEKVQRCRDAYAKHLRGAQGIVATDESALGTSLLIGEVRECPALKGNLQQVIEDVVEEGIAPDGEQVYDDPATVARVAKQLSLGFFYRWVWPDGIPDVEWLMARNDLARLVRWELEYRSATHYDSPRLVHAAVQESIAKKGKATTPLEQAWERWEAQRHKPEPPVEAVWLDEGIVKWAIDYAYANKRILWYQSKAVAAKLAELSPALRVFYAGETASDVSPRLAAYSVRAHGTGLNLQGYDKALILEPPSGGAAWEQLLGRLHRPGQQSDEVSFEVLAHTAPLRKCLTNGKNEAIYIASTTRNPQKLCAAVFYKK